MEIFIVIKLRRYKILHGQNVTTSAGQQMLKWNSAEHLQSETNLAASNLR